ncbi:thiamine pyrophosphate-requiring protein [Roseomonas sp. KE2513]|uniref:thiamine pyrophosphate-requiring protein n=1 Tax=Roseomonas sp. KE2513 TaxID=2479202 RepID=UPI0018E00CDB|nr:thiamine pyrophosphate-requiring protein [Roseomonas sp. KE2513]MBI0538202.1 thiamine pyrophosphate-requiring protein [Roseomonas sp. KE2513]
MARHTAAHHLIEAMCEAGIDHVFCNLGTDHVSVIEELARWDAEGRARPNTVLCPHENVAVHMAGGYAAMTGRGQPVLVHVDAGTANAAMALHNLFRARLPVFLMAGRAPFSSRGELPGGRDSYVHFVQDPYDIGSLVRPYVHWEYTLPSGVVAKEAFARGQAMMQAEPRAPVYMTLPREVLAEEIEDGKVHAYPADRFAGLPARGTDPATAQRIAEALMAAENPVAFTAYLGRNPAAVPVLDALARAVGMRVVEHAPIHLCIPHDSPCFAGFDPKALAAETDCGLLLDVDVPWIPLTVRPNPDASWMQVDVDPLKRDLPMWSFPAELRVAGDCAAVLAQVLEIVQERADEAFHARAAARIESWGPARHAREAAVAAAAAKPGEPDALNPAWALATLNRLISPGDILLNEAIRNGPVVQNQMPRTVPGSYIGLAGGGLGFSGGMALGVRLACPDRRVVQVVGDGTFHFSTPDSVYATAQQYGLPIFTVVLDNRGWQAVKESTLRVYPEGAARRDDNFQSRLDGRRNGAQRRFEDVARAFGAHGERAVTPEELEPAIRRCLEAVEGGQAAVLTIRVSPL